MSEYLQYYIQPKEVEADGTETDFTPETLVTTYTNLTTQDIIIPNTTSGAWTAIGAGNFLHLEVNSDQPLALRYYPLSSTGSVQTITSKLNYINIKLSAVDTSPITMEVQNASGTSANVTVRAAS
jgi:hypothetical protein